MFITTNTGANTASPIAGCTRIGTEVDTGTDATTAVYYKIASSEGASWTMTNLFDATEIGRFVVLVYGEVNASPINVSNQADAGTVTAVAGPSITTTTNRTMVIQMAGTDPGTGTYTATPDTDPVGTERFDGKDGSSNAYIAIQEYYQNALGAIALDLTGLTSDSYGSHQFALNPKVSINKSESVTIAESVSVEVTAAALIVNVTDSVTVSESNAVALPDALQVSKSETVTTAEAVAAVVRAAWYNADSIAINTGSLVSGGRPPTCATSARSASPWRVRWRWVL